MIILHGLWRPDRFHIWAERVGAAAAHDDGLVATRADAGGDTPTLQALDIESLHAVIGDCLRDALLSSIAEEARLTLALPARGDLPLPSVARQPATGRIPLDVPTLALAPADAVDLLTGLSEGTDVEVGRSLRYWRELALFALDLLARRQFVPYLTERDTRTFCGGWRPVVADPRELAWLETMAAALPRLCHSFARPSNGGQSSATGLIDSFLVATSDAIIRRSLDNDEFFHDVHERALHEEKWELCWLSTLIGPPRTVRWPIDDGPMIAAQIRGWLGRLDVESVDLKPELAFALREPPDDGDASRRPVWKLHLHGRHPESGALIDLASVWRAGEQSASVLGRHLVTRSAHLRDELARAATVCPMLRRVMSDLAPTEVLLDTTEAYAFIRSAAPLLVAQGFDVELPAWAADRSQGIGLELHVQPLEDPAPGRASDVSLGSLGLHSMLTFDWRVAVGGDQLTLEEFGELVAQGAPLVRVHGRWIDLDEAAAHKALQFVRQQPGGRISLAAAMRIAAGADDTDAGLPIVGLRGSSWVRRLLDETPEASVEPIEQPNGFRGELRPYQRRGLSWLWFLTRLGIGGCLADDMGLGKTIQLIALLLQERQNGSRPGPTLLFVPMSVVGNWRREIARFGPSLKTLVHHGPDRLGGETFIRKAEKSDVIITTYGLAHRDQAVLQKVKWHRLALDEAQKIKNPSAHQSTAVRALEAPHRLALTGTPLENHLSELWSIMEMLNPGLLGSAASFRGRFAVPVEKLGDQQRAEQLRRLIRPFMLRRIKSDPTVECDLPEKMEMRVFCNLTTEQAALYQSTVQQMLDEIDRAVGIRRRGLILATLTRLKQICNHPSHLLRDKGPLTGRSGKCERIVEMLEEVIEEGDAALVFTQYREMGDLLQKLLGERLNQTIPFLHGGTPSAERDRLVAGFQDGTSSSPIFLLSLKAGGFGLNLTRANHVFHFDRWWNPAVEEQATDRVHRIGQTRRVQVHKFVCIGTIEDRIDKLLSEKAALADRIVGSGDEWLTGLSTRELRDYLTLTEEAVAEN